ncbi:ComEC/Rec2 family competence protein [Pilimelia columellifera]|uniref:ComEC/Rec2 family competence protein n=1 Tax=Pilimelia columellifera subsp. columellifera TaxID=706583 RepID=A0ABN3NPR0_9ACTN
MSPSQSPPDVAQPRRSDLRLAAFAVGVWLAALAALALPARGAAVGLGALGVGWLVIVAVAHPAGAASLGRAVTTPFTPAMRAPARVATVALIGALAGAGSALFALAVRDAAPVSDLARERAVVEAEVVVRDDPRPLGVSGGGPARWLVPAETIVLTTGGRRIVATAKVVVLATGPGWARLLPGQRVRVVARAGPPRGVNVTALSLTATEPPTVLGRPPWLQRAAGALRDGLQHACRDLPAEPGGLLPGLTVGDTSRLDAAVAADFRTTGMTHLVAVSGGNIVIVVGAVVLLARWARVGRRTAAVLGGIALVGFIILARPSPSVVRAGVMAAIGLLALGGGRPRAAVPALAATVALLVLYDPALAADPGFALSAMATGGLLLFAPGWRDGLRSRGVPAGLAEAIAIPAAAQLACGPVIAALSATVSPVAVVANLLAGPAVAPVTILGVLAAVVSPLSPALAEGLAWLGQWPARWLVAVARFGADAPFAELPWPGGVGGGLLLAAVTVLMLLALRRRAFRTVAATVAAATMIGAAPVRMFASGWPPTGWLAVACDVGQGDAAVLAAGPGSAVVIDAGPEPAAVDRCLRRLGVRRVPLLVVSHFHADHIGGVAGVLRGRQVGAVVTGELRDPAAGYHHVARVAGGIPVAAARAGWVTQVGQVRLVVLGPAAPLRATRSDPNNNSLAVRAVVGGVSFLFVGDAEQEQQQELVSAGLARPADVLKLAHHGSAYQSAEFLDAVRPSVALVSVGRHNRYGHPNPGVLGHLRRNGGRVVRTDLAGDIAVVADGSRIAVAVAGQAPGGAPTARRRRLSRRTGTVRPLGGDPLTPRSVAADPRR